MGVLTRSGPTGNRRDSEEVFLAATEALLDEGSSYADLTVERIAARAGRPRTAFYLYFRDKRQLLMRLTERVATIFYEQAEGWWAGEGGADELRVALERIMTTYREHASLMGAMVEASGYDERINGFWRTVIDRFVVATRDRLVREGASPQEAAAKAFTLVWMTERVNYQQLAAGEPLDTEDVRAAVVEVWQRSVYAA